MTPFEKLKSEMTGFMRSSVLAVLAELDLGTLLLHNNNALSATQAAKLCACDARAMESLLDALCALDYLNKRGCGIEATYSVAEEYIPYLDSGHPYTYIPVMRHLANAERVWARLTWAVKDGRLPEPHPSILGAEQDRLSYITGMNAITERLVRETIYALRKAGVLTFDKENVRILDIGGACGTYSECFLEQVPGSTVTIFDLPEAIAFEKQRIAGTDHKKRIDLVEGSFTQSDLPTGFDFVWISAIIHHMSREQSRELYAKALRALNPGGLVAVRDYVMNQEHTSPLDGALYGIYMLVSTPSGRVHSWQEIKEDLESCDFIDITHAVDVPNRSAVVTARKAAS